VSTWYLGDNCRGWTTDAPTYTIYYTAGAGSVLQFYFIGTDDPTLIVIGPDGGIGCNDDSFSTLSPTLSFGEPVTGWYDVWVGSRFNGVAPTGTLRVTESYANHP
jgi:hypothetical protein